MFSKYVVPALAATNLLNGVEAASHHRHMHKRDIVYAATEVDFTTVYETVTVFAGDETSTSSTSSVPTQSFYAASHPSSSSSEAATTTASSSASAGSPLVASSATTLVSVVSSDAAVAIQDVTSAAETTTVPTTTAVPTTTSIPTTYAAAATTTTAAAATTSTQAASTYSSSSSSGRRGLGYNDASLVSTIVSVASTTFGWCYDWGFTSGGLTANVEYIPMLWGPTHYSSAWDTAAAAAISGGTEALFSFNECDNAGQANLDAATAATYHQQYLGPYKGQIKIGAPAITSSETTGQGLSWLSEFFTACGSSCAVDFVNVHWYGPGGEEGAQEFLNFLVKANTQTGYNVWVTEFGAISGDETTFLTYALDQLDNNSTFAFVDKYAYFYLATGYLFDSTTSLSSLGSIYASAS